MLQHYFTDIEKLYKPCTVTELRELARDGKREQVMQALAPLGVSIATKFHNAYKNDHIDLEDLVSVANLSIAVAVQSWDPNKEAAATTWVWGPLHRDLHRYMMREQERQRQNVSLDKELPNGSSMYDVLAAQLADHGQFSSPQDVVDRELGTTYILDNMDKLTDRQLEAMTLYYMGPQRRTYTQVGKMMGISRQTVKEILDTALRTLKAQV